MAKDYSDNKYTFPSDKIDPKKKQEAPYALAWAKAAWRLFQKEQGGTKNTRHNEIDLLRRYGQGRQPVEKYLDILCPKNKHGKRKSYMDLSTDPISVIPKFRSIVVGKFMQMHHEITANAIDEKSGAERRSMRFDLWAESQLQAQLEPFKNLVSSGVDPSEAQKIIPKTIEELDMLEANGSFKLKWETGMEKLLKDSFYISDWDSVKYKLYEDAFDLGKMATRDYTDLTTGKAMTRYVDQAQLVKRYSKDRKSKNIDYAGEVLDLSPNQIRTEAGEELPANIIEQIISENNQKSNYDYSYDNTNSDFYEKHGNQNIKVLDLAWITNDTIKQEKITANNGETYYNNVDYNFEKRKDNQEILEGQIQMVYSCRWIIGTDYVYWHGQEEDILRPTPKTVKLPFNFYKISDKSMLEMVIPNEDNLNLAWLRFQNGIAKSAPPGVAVDVSALKNVSNGVNKMKPLDVLQLRRETGDLLFSATTHHNQVISPNSGRPIFDIPGGAGNYLKEQMEIIQFNISMIRDITGINEIMDATAPPPNTLVGTAEIAEKGTNNVQYTLYNAYKSIYEGTASNLSFRIQNIIRYKDYKPYENVIGTALLNIFKQGSPISAASFGIKIALKPQEKEKQALLAQAGLAFQQGILKYSDIMYLQQEVEEGSIKQARMYITYKEGKYMEEEAAKTQANTEAQSAAIIEQQENAKNGRMEEAEFASSLTKDEIAFRSNVDTEEYGKKNAFKKEEDDNKSKNKVVENLTK